MGKKGYKGIPLSQRRRQQIARYQSGDAICVARPAKPERAMQLIYSAIEESKGAGDDVWETLQIRLNEECGPYTFVGYMGLKSDTIVDEFGNVIGLMERGDSLVHESFFTGNDSGIV